MATAEWEITGKLGQLQLAWLREHYTPQQVDEALRGLRGLQRPYPLNVARLLERQGGPKMPPADALHAADPATQAAQAEKKAAAFARIRELQRTLRQS